MARKYKRRVKKIQKVRQTNSDDSQFDWADFPRLYGEAHDQKKFLDTNTGEFITREQLKERFPIRYARLDSAERAIGSRIFTGERVEREEDKDWDGCPDLSAAVVGFQVHTSQPVEKE